VASFCFPTRPLTFDSSRCTAIHTTKTSMPPLLHLSIIQVLPNIPISHPNNSPRPSNPPSPITSSYPTIQPKLSNKPLPTPRATPRATPIRPTIRPIPRCQRCNSTNVSPRHGQCNGHKPRIRLPKCPPFPQHPLSETIFQCLFILCSWETTIIGVSVET
jgi:hypothetical protein